MTPISRLVEVLTDQDFGILVPELVLHCSLLVIRDLVIVASARPVSADLLGETMDTLQESKAGERLPFLILVREVRNAGTRAELGFELEKEIDERNVVKGLREGGFGFGKDKVASLDYREASLGNEKDDQDFLRMSAYTIAQSLPWRPLQCCWFESNGSRW